MSRSSSKYRSKNVITTLITSKWQVALLIFVFALSVRMVTLNKIGKTWDEGAYVELGHRYVELALKHDYTNPYWYLQSDHPPLARYIYGLASTLDSRSVNGKTVFNISYTTARTVSSIMGSITALLIVLMGYKYFSPFVGISSGLIFSLIPFFVGLSQLGTLESPIMLSFTATVFFFLEFLTKNSLKNFFLTGLLLGCSILVKQSNVIIVPLLILISVIRNVNSKNKFQINKLFVDLKSVVLLSFIALFTCFVLWPMPFFHLNELLAVQNKMWVHAVKLPPPEVFFGRLMLVPFPYYFLMFAITTPLLLLVLGAIGALRIDKKKTFIGMSILIWFLFPFLQTFYPFKQHGVRYIIEIYAPFALLCGIGLEYFNDKFLSKHNLKIHSLGFVILYLLLTLWKITPYYLDYYNEVVGGNNYVYSHKLFQMGWWGQGIEEAAKFISLKEDAIVTVAVNGPQPATVMPSLWNIKTVYYDKKMDSDYVIVPYFDVVRLGFREEELQGKYREVHSVLVDRAKLVKIYKHI